MPADVTSSPPPAFSWNKLISRGLKPVAHVLCLLPLAWLLYLTFVTGNLGANPVEYIIRYLGDWALRFLLIALAVTPVRILTGWLPVARLRRTLGLYAFFYVLLHIAGYVVIDHFFDWKTIWADIVKRTYITVGMAVFLALLPLAVTSTAGMVKRLGGARWKMLHRLVYAAGIGGVVHFYMMVKLDVREPLLYAAILAVLLGWRVAKRAKNSA